MSIEINETVREVAAAQHEATAEILAEGCTPAKTLEIASNAFGWATNLIKGYRALCPDESRVACKAGCDHCCQLHVDVSPPEAFAIACFLHDRHTPDTVNATIKRLRELLGRVDGLSVVKRGGTGLPCGLLVNRRCSVYPVRPLACLGWTSRSVRTCKAGLTNPAGGTPVDGVVFKIAEGARQGMQSALAEASLPPPSVELTRALLVALVVPDAAARWLRGEPVFDTPTDQLMTPDASNQEVYP